MSATVVPRWRRDLAIALAALLLVAAWDFSGADFALSRLFGGDTGFALRDHFVTSVVLHDGGRLLAGVLLALLLLDALRPLVPGPSRRARAAWLAVTVGAMIAVPAIKRLSHTSCPWDVEGLGGHWPYVPHWLSSAVDGGPGHCFPSGHAVAAFAFFGLHFLWRDHRPRLARAALFGVLAAGAVFGLAQLARGAHYASHTLWSAWLCWAIALSADLAMRARATGVRDTASA